MEARAAGTVSSTSGGAGWLGRSFGGAADQARSEPEDVGVERVDRGQDGVDEAPRPRPRFVPRVADARRGTRAAPWWGRATRLAGFSRTVREQLRGRGAAAVVDERLDAGGVGGVLQLPHQPVHPGGRAAFLGGVDVDVAGDLRRAQVGGDDEQARRCRGCGWCRTARRSGTATR